MRTRDKDARVASYSAIAGELTARIQSGAISDGSYLPTERELQEEFKVSRTTIRRALAKLVDAGFAAGIRNKGVVAKTANRHDHSGRLLAFVDHTASVHQYLYFALNRLLSQQGIHLVHVDSTRAGTEGALEYCASHGFAGALVWSKTATPDVARFESVLSSLPVVSMDHAIPGVPTDLIGVDSFSGAKTAVQHLLSRGRKRVGIAGWFDSLDTTHARFAGYIEGLIRSNASPDSRDFLFCMTSGMAAPLTEPIRRRMMDHDRPDALFLMEEFTAPAVIESIQDCGLRIPDDVALVSIGNETPFEFGDAGLTTLGIDWDQFAERCVECVLARMTYPERPPETIRLPVELIIRGSCGSPRDQWSERPCLECGRPPKLSDGIVESVDQQLYRAIGTTEAAASLSIQR